MDKAPQSQDIPQPPDHAGDTPDPRNAAEPVGKPTTDSGLYLSRVAASDGMQKRQGDDISGDIPGKAMPDWQLYRARVGPDGAQTGVVSPDGGYTRFEKGEEFLAVREGNDRVPSVQLTDGKVVRFDAWKSRQREGRRDVFDAADPMFGDLFMYAIEAHPELDQVQIAPGTKDQYPVLEYTGGFWRAPSETSPHPTIVVYLGGKKRYEGFLRDRELSARAAARSMGIEFETVQQHPEVLAAFIFLHEMGHAKDFVANYQDADGKRAPDSPDPATANRQEHAKQMSTLPYPGVNPATMRRKLKSGELGEKYEQYERYFREKGINSPEALAAAQEQAYRKLPKEAYADKFASEMLRKYWGSLGFDSITGISPK